MQQRLPSMIDPPVTFAHRGARAHAAENTMEAFRLALRLGARGLETDCWRTADGEVVCDHDGVVRNGLRKRPIGEVTRSALPSHVPTLAEVLSLCEPEGAERVHVSIDLKDDAVGELIVDLVHADFPALADRVWLCHPDWQHVAALRPRTDGIRLVDSTRLKRIAEGPERRAARLRDVGVDALNMHHTDWNGGLVALLHRFDRFALAWDLQHDHLLVTVLRMGVDGVFSDWVDRMVEAVDTY